MEKKFCSGQIDLLMSKWEMNITDLSARLGMPYKTVYNYSSGRSLPKADFIYALYKEGVNIVWFVTGDGKMFTDCDDCNLSDRGSRLCAWINHYMETHEKDDRAWFDVEMSRKFPEYKDWKDNL